MKVTSYICLLDSLIDHPEDVKVLRKAGILDNRLGSDKQVALLFNELGTDLVPNSFAYSEPRSAIQKHYESEKPDQSFSGKQTTIPFRNWSIPNSTCRRDSPEGAAKYGWIFRLRLILQEFIHRISGSPPIAHDSSRVVIPILVLGVLKSPSPVNKLIPQRNCKTINPNL
ncbi:hypothetical protein L1887_17927 [Cichorium endivia]|nr:hypothetical protein L1887_17927 [Cichorium endivia]